ncbi:MAG TPA: hypothetical protein VLQ93_02670 [Myxococcaceae bacterium]|nr:hypothetical protein [Myxococcaceae bacterium]
MLESLVIQPFSLHYDCNDYHIFLYIEGHPEYESMEAMIQERGGGRVFVRAIITRHDKCQVDYLNEPQVVALYKSLGRKREVHYAPMQYARAEVEGCAHIRLRFSSLRGEDIVLESRSEEKASGEHVRLVDPLGHSGSISLPVMYPERSALCGPESSISIDGKSFGGARDVVPRLYEGLKGFYSENFRIGVFCAGSERLQVRQAPGSLRPGEKWVYASATRKGSYEIVDMRGSRVWIEGGNEKLLAEWTDEGLALRVVSLLASSRERSQSDFSLFFEPGLPISPTADGHRVRAESDFSISIDDNAALITGRATSERDGSIVELLLDPARPGWARKVATAVRPVGGALLVRTEVMA